MERGGAITNYKILGHLRLNYMKKINNFTNFKLRTTYNSGHIDESITTTKPHPKDIQVNVA